MNRKVKPTGVLSPIVTILLLFKSWSYAPAAVSKRLSFPAGLGLVALKRAYQAFLKSSSSRAWASAVPLAVRLALLTTKRMWMVRYIISSVVRV